MPSFQYDVTIVGAGPAGCILSYLLAKSGKKVLLIERDASFIREFRGPAYQPCIVEYFNQMGILDEVLSVDHSTLHEFAITEEKKTLFTIDLHELPPPYNYAIAMQQGPLLRKLIQLASEFPNLTFLGNTAVDDLVTTNGMVTGIKVTIDGEERKVSSRLVVGADGRFSTIRKAARIPLTKAKQAFDVVWFDYPIASDIRYDLGLEISEEGIVVFIPQEKGHIRVGWILEKGGYDRLKKEGIEKFRNRLIAIKPELTDHLPSALQSFDQCSFLDVNIASAQEWTKDGLLLIGDAAHIASPVGAQGNKLAIQDAVMAHPAIINALNQHLGTIRGYQLIDYVKERKKEAHFVFNVQQIIGKAILGIRNPLINKIRQVFFPLFRRFLAPYLLRVIGHGRQPVSVAHHLFSFTTDYGQHHRYYLLPIKKIVKETHDASSFYFEVPQEFNDQYNYEPGQFITLRLLDKGQLHKRCYSLSSIPGDEHLRITVKRVDKGLISNDLIDTIEVGTELLVLPPAGQFVAKKSAKHYCMIAGGSGITPIMSLIRSLLQNSEVETIRLIDVNHEVSSIIFQVELNDLQEQHPKRLQVIHNLTVASPNWNGFVGRLTFDRLEHLLDQLPEETQYYLCGPTGLQNLVQEVLQSRSISHDAIHVEKFTSLIEPFESVHGKSDKKSLIVGKSAESKTDNKHVVTISLKGQTVSIQCRIGESILDAALRSGIDAPFSCREGICATCKAQLINGKVVMDYHQALTESEAKAGHILTCQARPLTKECLVNYPDES